MRCRSRKRGHLSGNVSLIVKKRRWADLLTLAVLGAESNDSASIFRAAGLVGAVAHTVAEVGLTAVALNVTLGAAEVVVRNAEHVVDTSALETRVSTRLRNERDVDAGAIEVNRFVGAKEHGLMTPFTNGSAIWFEQHLHRTRGESRGSGQRQWPRWRRRERKKPSL